MPVVFKVFRYRKLFWLLVAGLLILMGGIYRSVTGYLEARQVSALSWALVGKIVVVDPGHGGRDPGAVGKSGVKEKEITLQVAKKLALLLEQGGAAVLLTREDDSELAASKREDLDRRADIANENGADIFVSIHVNSFRSGPREHGAQTFSQPGSQESRLLSSCIQDELIRILGNTDRKPKEVDYYINKATRMPSVVVEIGFITNEREEKLMQDPAYQQKVAYAIYAGIVKYFARQATPTDREKIVETFMQNEEPFTEAP